MLDDLYKGLSTKEMGEEKPEPTKLAGYIPVQLDNNSVESVYERSPLATQPGTTCHPAATSLSHAPHALNQTVPANSTLPCNNAQIAPFLASDSPTTPSPASGSPIPPSATAPLQAQSKTKLQPAKRKHRPQPWNHPVLTLRTLTRAGRASTTTPRQPSKRSLGLLKASLGRSGNRGILSVGCAGKEGVCVGEGW